MSSYKDTNEYKKEVDMFDKSQKKISKVLKINIQKGGFENQIDSENSDE